MTLRLNSVSRCCSFAVIVLFGTLSGLNVSAQTPQTRITQPILESQRVTLSGHVHPLAKAKYDQGAVDESVQASRMLLLLLRTEAQQAALDKLLDEQQTPGSANYHRWLTPEEFGAQFGASDADVQKVSVWLTSQGFTVENVAASKSLIEFSGSAAQVKRAFQSELHSYALPSGTYTANNADPQIPVALAPVVRGFVSLNNFPRRPYSKVRGVAVRNANGTVRPQWTSTSGGFFAVGPGDFATIYNSVPLLNNNIDGSGQTIGIVGQSNINLTDVANFRSLFGLSDSVPTVVIGGTVDPGIQHSSGDEGEAVMDVEWAGATAPGATIKLVIAKSTNTTSGVDLAAQYLVNQNLADVLSESYGACEPEMLTSGNAFYNSLWQQAAAQGITVVVASGDNGSAGCEDPSSASVSENNYGGVAVNGIASTPYNVAVGGTDFNNSSTTDTYWSSTNYTDGSTGQKHISALGYIPESTWNDSCAHSATSTSLTTCAGVTSTDSSVYGTLQLWAASGGPSNCAVSTVSGNNIDCTSGYPKPSWQTGTGVPNDGARDVPDVSLFAATGASGSNSFYVACQADDSGSCVASSSGSVPFLGVGGTSASTPNFAAIIALAGQKLGNQRLGNVNQLLYTIAAQNGASCASSGSPSSSCVFYDTQVGNISVPCNPGSPDCSVRSGTAKGVLVANGAPAYMATAGYDTATGLGSVNITNLVAALANLAVPTISTPTAPSSTLTVGNYSTTLTATVTGTSTSGVPTGTITFKDKGTVIGNVPTTSNPSNYTLTGTVSYTLSEAGTRKITAEYSGDSTYSAGTSAPLILNADPAFTLRLASQAISVSSSGGSGTNTVTFTPASGGIPASTIVYYCTSNSTAASCTPASTSAGTANISNAAVTANVTYTVPALSAVAKPGQRVTPWKVSGGLLFAGVFIFGVPGIRKRRQLVVTMFLIAVLALTVSCGGGSGGSSQSSGSTTTVEIYKFTVTATTTAYGVVSTQTSTFTVTN